MKGMHDKTGTDHGLFADKLLFESKDSILNVVLTARCPDRPTGTLPILCRPAKIQVPA